jgi:hypothetical protein
MRNSLVYLMFATISISMFLPITVSIAKPLSKVNAVTIAKTISPTAALHRLIVAEKLEARWFTPEFLKAVDKNSDVNALQLQRDITLKLGRFRYGNYKSVQSIGNDQYRIIFDRAEPDAVIAQFQIDRSGRIAGIRLAEKNKPEPTRTAQSQTVAEATLDRSFRNNVGSDGKPKQLFVSLKQWLGNYQKVRKVDANNYFGIFARGNVPVTVNFKSDGSIDNFGMTCPILTKPLSLSQAPADLRKLLAPCPNLK